MNEPSAGRVLGEAALDLSDLLTAIRASVERARLKVGPDVARDELREIERLVSRASLLTGRVLAISRTTRLVETPGESTPEHDADTDGRNGGSSSAIV